MKTRCLPCIIIVGLLAGVTLRCPADQQASAPSVIELAGSWRFQLDPSKQGVKERWYERTLPDEIKLPGTTDEAGKGIRNEQRETRHLTRVFYYTGPAWYQRDVEIPESWRGKRITLFLERSKETSVWVDGRLFGIQNSLSAPHIHEFSAAMTPGKHVLTIQVDNTKKLPLGDPHAITEETQTNWNGIVGRIELQATDPVWIKDVHVYPDVKTGKAKVRVILGNATGKPAKGNLTLAAQSHNTGRVHTPPRVTIDCSVSDAESAVEADYALGTDALRWDEFLRALYRLTVSLSVSSDTNRYTDRRSVDFGMREFRTRGTRFTINDRTIFLRGKVDACVYPITGYPPMTVDGWRRVFQIAQSYGINHYRFHTWCPPQAAFTAADEMGIYLEPELPNWTTHGFGERPHDQYMREETDRILDTYGNHPSFVMFTLGNELPQGRPIMAEFVRYCRQKDPRRLYAEGSNNFWENPSLAPGDDFWITMMTVKWEKMVRASCHYHNIGHVNNLPPSTMVDYSQSIAGIPVPIISHEIGQYSIYPNFKEIKKYTGVLRARNFEIYRESLQANHMLDQADDFLKASGALSVICYKEEIEAALRTPGFGGIQLMDIQDFPGQGAALVGFLDVFMNSKGLVTPAQFREFCNSTVPLLRMAKYSWTSDETFTAGVQVAHFGPVDLPKMGVAWSIRDIDGRKIALGMLPTTNIPQGSLFDLGKLSVPLSGVSTPAKLTLTLNLKGTNFVNHYPIWVYPAAIGTAPPADVIVSQKWDEPTRSALARGSKVLLLPALDALPKSVPGAFQPDFCNYALFGKKYNPPGTQGILCDPRHPALAQFPTEFHSNWQWWDLVKKSRPIILDDTPPAFRPLVQAIDNFVRNQKLGIVFETKVDRGRLLVCSIDLENDLPHRPVARQLRHSLLSYMHSDRFQPALNLDEQILNRLLTPDR